MKIIIKLIRLYLSAWLGNANAQNDIGCMYSTGNEVSQDHTKALNWFRRAAEQGHADAQRNMGLIYYLGIGVIADCVRAATWFRFAAEQGQIPKPSRMYVLHRPRSNSGLRSGVYVVKLGSSAGKYACAK